MSRTGGPELVQPVEHERQESDGRLHVVSVDDRTGTVPVSVGDGQAYRMRPGAPLLHRGGVGASAEQDLHLVIDAGLLGEPPLISDRRHPEIRSVILRLPQIEIIR